MVYIAESLPGPVAEALPAYASALTGSTPTLSQNDLAIATDAKDRTYFGLVARGTPAGDVKPATFTTALEGDRTVPARLPEGTAPKSLRVIPGRVARSIVVALTEHRSSAPPGKVGTVGWRVQDEVVVVMVAPARSSADAATIGGATSGGREVHYHVETKSFAIVRTTFAR